jgi:predicted nucleic acid-binding protein
MNGEKFLIDTTVWVNFLRGLDESVRDRLSVLVNEERAFTSEIVILEILRGAKSEKEYSMLLDDFLALPQLTLDRKTWEIAWGNSFELKKKGLTIPIVDLLISALAIRYECSLLHSDKHFSLLAKHLGIKAIHL